MTFSIHRLFICKICKSHIWQDLGEYQCIFTEFPVLFPVEDRLHFSSSRGYIWLFNEIFISKIWIPNPNQNNLFTNLVFYRHFATFWQHIYIKWNVGNFIQLLISRFLRLHIHKISLFVNIINKSICMPIVFWIKREKIL